MDALLRLTTLPSIELASWFVMAFVSPLTAVALLVFTAPLGKMLSKESSALWGMHINPRVAWLVMEAPNLIALPLYLSASNDAGTGNPGASGSAGSAAVSTFLLCLFVFHYVHRALIYPFRVRSAAAFPFVPFAMAFTWCLYNGIMHGCASARLDDRNCRI